MKSPRLSLWVILLSAILLTTYGCVSRKTIREASADRTIILDTTRNYAPRAGDSYTFYLRINMMSRGWLNWYRMDENKPYYDSIRGFLIKHPELTIEIGYHTDFRGSLEYSDTLCLRMAREIVAAFTEPELNPSRIIARGYGKHFPLLLKEETYVPEWKTTFPRGTYLTEEFINSLETRNEKEAAHHLNRRFEMTILKTG